MSWLELLVYSHILKIKMPIPKQKNVITNNFSTLKESFYETFTEIVKDINQRIKTVSIFSSASQPEYITKYSLKIV